MPLPVSYINVITSYIVLLALILGENIQGAFVKLLNL